MDVLFGLVGDGFVLLVSDTSRVQSIVVQRTEVDKIVQLDGHKLMARPRPPGTPWRAASRPRAQATSGSPGDADNFSEIIKANLKLYELRNQSRLTTHAAANYTRNELATALRKARGCPPRASAPPAPPRSRARPLLLVNPNKSPPRRRR